MKKQVFGLLSFGLMLSAQAQQVDLSERFNDVDYLMAVHKCEEYGTRLPTISELVLYYQNKYGYGDGGIFEVEQQFKDVSIYDQRVKDYIQKKRSEGAFFVYKYNNSGIEVIDFYYKKSKHYPSYGVVVEQEGSSATLWSSSVPADYDNTRVKYRYDFGVSTGFISLGWEERGNPYGDRGLYAVRCIK